MTYSSMAAHSSVLAWRIPWTEEPSGLQPRVTKSGILLKKLERKKVKVADTTVSDSLLPHAMDFSRPDWSG